MDIMKFGHNSLITWTEADLRQERQKEKQMRQYRGLTKEGKWVYGGLYELPNGMAFIVTNNPFPPSSWSFNIGSFFVSLIEVLLKSVGQSTGLKDKNGKEIYEGDIAISGMGTEQIYRDVCEWNKERCMFMWVSLPDGDIQEYIDEYEVEVIGNIHQNPKLMEQGNGK